MTSPLQDTFLWKMERVGKVTGSRVADIVARTRTGYSASRANYLGQLVAERLTGVSAESTYSSPAMQWGLEQEARARAAYAFYGDVDVVLAPFVPHPGIEMAGASPDGLVGEDGLVELKCPNTATHIETLVGGTIPQKYQIQMLWQMACTGRSWCDFVSFDPRLPESLGILVCRLERDDARISELEEEVRTFLFEVDTTVRRLIRTEAGTPAERLKPSLGGHATGARHPRTAAGGRAPEDHGASKAGPLQHPIGRDEGARSPEPGKSPAPPPRTPPQVSQPARGEL